jgi:diguanylate cyclase (GGDEF)-like protein
MAWPEQLKALRGHHAALTSHQQILKDHVGNGRHLIGENDVEPLFAQLRRLVAAFPEFDPEFDARFTGRAFTGRAQDFEGDLDPGYDSNALLGHVDSVLARLTGVLAEHPLEETEPLDALTQLPTRGAFDVALRTAHDVATREHLPLSLVFGDVDHFKKVNDTHGHQAGDDVLRHIARVLERVAQGKGRVYRWGGEEFGVILSNHSVDEAVSVAERARRAVEAEHIGSLSVTMSFGVACVPDDAKDIKTLIAAADKALYDAKNLGRNLVRRFGEPPPTAPGPREPGRKPAEPGRLTDAQKAELRSRHLQGERIRCPRDRAFLEVKGATGFGSHGRQFVAYCPDCGLIEELKG